MRLGRVAVVVPDGGRGRPDQQEAAEQSVRDGPPTGHREHPQVGAARVRQYPKLPDGGGSGKGGDYKRGFGGTVGAMYPFAPVAFTFRR